MLTHDYLALRLNRIRASDDWSSNGQGIAFVLVTGGRGAFDAHGVRHPFGPGDVLVFNHGTEGQLSVDQGSEAVFWCFTVQMTHLFPLFANEEVWLLQDLESRFKSVRIYPASTPVAAQCHRLVAEAPPQFNLDHRSHLLRVAAAVLSVELTNARPQHGAYVPLEEHLNQIFEKLSTDEILGLSVDELAGKFNCSRRHLNRLFHHRFGLSVSSLRMELRLLKAASLLRDAGTKIINVAEQCAFNHLGLFNTCFKRRFGMSPGEWRRQPAQTGTTPVIQIPEEGACQLRANGLCPWCIEAPTPAPQNGLKRSFTAAPPPKISPTSAPKRAAASAPSRETKNGSNGKSNGATPKFKLRIRA